MGQFVLKTTIPTFVVVRPAEGETLVPTPSTSAAVVTTSTQVVVDAGTRRLIEVGRQGPPGPPGPPGASGSGYTHPQLTPALTWVIAHNLGFRPAVDLYDLGGREFDAEIVHLSENVLEVRCLTPTAGYARLT